MRVVERPYLFLAKNANRSSTLQFAFLGLGFSKRIAGPQPHAAEFVMTFASFPTWNPSIGFWGNLVVQVFFFAALAAIFEFIRRLNGNAESKQSISTETVSPVLDVPQSPVVAERTTALPIMGLLASPEVAEWHVIHAGTELGPISQAELIAKAFAREIADDDLVKRTGGLWSKAGAYRFLAEEFHRASQTLPGKLFQGIWLSKRTLAVGGGALLVLVGLATVWASGMAVREKNPGRQLEENRRHLEENLGTEQDLKTGQAVVRSNYRIRSWIFPHDPSIGEDYSVNVEVTNLSSRFVTFVVNLGWVPLDDPLRSPDIRRAVVAPGASDTVSFHFRCGVRNPRVSYDVRAFWSN